MVRCLSKNANSGIYVSESLSSGQPIPVRRETGVAFLGSAPRGLVGIPVKVDSVDDYLKRFGVPGCDTPLPAYDVSNHTNPTASGRLRLAR